MDIRQLPVMREAPAVDHGVIQEACVVGHEPMMRRGNRRPQSRDGIGNVQRIRIRGLRENALSRILLTRSLVTTVPPAGIGLKPYRSRDGTAALFGVLACNASRNRSETTLSAGLPSRAASVLAAARTSSSISIVVLHYSLERATTTRARPPALRYTSRSRDAITATPRTAPSTAPSKRSRVSRYSVMHGATAKPAPGSAPQPGRASDKPQAAVRLVQVEQALADPTRTGWLLTGQARRD